MNKHPFLASCVFALVLLPILVGTSFALFKFGAHPFVASLTMIVLTLCAAKFALPAFLKRWNVWLA